MDWRTLGSFGAEGSDMFLYMVHTGMGVNAEMEFEMQLE